MHDKNKWYMVMAVSAVVLGVALSGFISGGGKFPEDELPFCILVVFQILPTNVLLGCMGDINAFHVVDVEIA